MNWRYFDFDTHWPEFYKVWTSDPVQHVLEPSMIRWCDTNAYFDTDGNKPKWIPKSDLWRYSRTDYHHQRMLDKANAYVQQNRSIKMFGDSLQRANTPIRDVDALADYFLTSGAFEAIEEMFVPPAKSLEANVLVMGANFLAETQAFAGEILLPGKETLVRDDYLFENEIAIVPSEKIILDFQRYYHWKTGCEDMAPDELMKAFDLDIDKEELSDE